MTIEEQAKQCATRIIEWCFTKDREGLDDNLPTTLITELLQEQQRINDERWRKDMTYVVTKKQEWIDKACEWLKEHNDKCELTEMVNIEEFRKAMEDKIWKQMN